MYITYFLHERSRFLLINYFSTQHDAFLFNYLLDEVKVRYGFYRKYTAIWHKKINLPSKLLRSLYNCYNIQIYLQNLYIPIKVQIFNRI